MVVYVINKNGNPLMPCSPCKAKHLLKQRKAVVCKRVPFTIKLKSGVTEYKQDITLGVDCGYKTIGLSASTDNKVLYEAEVEVRGDIPTLLEARLSMRRGRRHRNTRYREARFNNRVHSKHKGWLAPSVEARVNQHMQMVDKVASILPISAIHVEVAAFDIQKIKNPDIEGTGYQQGDQLGFWNVREYVLWRDGHQCQHCHGKSKDNVLEVHHLVQRKDGGSDRPDNLITLCSKCHSDYHKGKFTLEKPKGGFKGAAFMGIMRWTFYNRLKEKYTSTSLTYGYITKNTRITNGLPKAHYIDARCIAEHPKAVSDGSVYHLSKQRSHNRQLHKCKILKGGIRKRNQAARKVFGYALNDMVRYNDMDCLIHGRRSSGYFDIRKPNGEKVNASVNCEELRLVEHAKQYLIYKEFLACSSPA